MSEKKCFKCGEVKSLSEFYKHKMMADGHVNKCKDCNKIDVAQNRVNKIEYYREYDRLRGNRQTKEDVKSYRTRFPMKYAAHIIVANAVRDGRLSKTNKCSECGKVSSSIHGHHDDYAMALYVRWLCPLCHKKWHKENGQAKNAV
jgi:hypothetical protein